jgi:hypothetical protein
MSGTDGPKSSYQLAMERLQKRDADGGVERRPPSDEQKAAIAELRNVYGAKLAQADLAHQASVNRTFDPAELALLGDAYRREREQLTGELESKVEKVRGGPTSSPSRPSEAERD